MGEKALSAVVITLTTVPTHSCAFALALAFVLHELLNHGKDFFV